MYFMEILPVAIAIVQALGVVGIAFAVLLLSRNISGGPPRKLNEARPPARSGVRLRQETVAIWSVGATLLIAVIGLTLPLFTVLRDEINEVRSRSLSAESTMRYLERRLDDQLSGKEQ